MEKKESKDVMIKEESTYVMMKQEESKDVQLIQKYVHGEIDLNKPYYKGDKEHEEVVLDMLRIYLPTFF